MFVKSFGVSEPIREALASLADRIELTFLFGSMVNGKAGLSPLSIPTELVKLFLQILGFPPSSWKHNFKHYA